MSDSEATASIGTITEAMQSQLSSRDSAAAYALDVDAPEFVVKHRSILPFAFAKRNGALVIDIDDGVAKLICRANASPMV